MNIAGDVAKWENGIVTFSRRDKWQNTIGRRQLEEIYSAEKFVADIRGEGGIRFVTKGSKAQSQNVDH